MKRSELQHGDVLLYEKRKNQGFLPRAIRLITGSRFTHAGVVQDVEGSLVILEQVSMRIYSFVSLYTLEEKTDEAVYCFRPRFEAPKYQPELFKHKGYGDVAIVDCALNHGIGLVARNYEYRPLLVSLFKRTAMVCSGLVATALDLKNNTTWCHYPGVTEPDDLSEHPESFVPMGLVRWD